MGETLETLELTKRHLSRKIPCPPWIAIEGAIQHAKNHATPLDVQPRRRAGWTREDAYTAHTFCHRGSLGTKYVDEIVHRRQSLKTKITEDQAHRGQGRSVWARQSQGCPPPTVRHVARHVTSEPPGDEDFEGPAKKSPWDERTPKDTKARQQKPQAAKERQKTPHGDAGLATWPTTRSKREPTVVPARRYPTASHSPTAMGRKMEIGSRRSDVESRRSEIGNRHHKSRGQIHVVLRAAKDASGPSRN